MMRRPFTVLLFAALLLVSVAPAAAQETPPLNPTFEAAAIDPFFANPTIANAEPLQPVVNSVARIQIVNCGGIECLLSRLVLPASEFLDDWSVQLRNNGGEPITITRGTVVMRASNSGIVVNEQQIAVAPPANPIASFDIGAATLRLRRDLLSPGMYEGEALFFSENGQPPVTVALQVMARVGCILPALAIIMGILIGRLARGLEAPESIEQLRIVPLLNTLGDSANNLSAAEAALIRARIEGIRARNDRLEPAADLRTAIAALDQRIAGLRELANIETELSKPTWDNSPLKATLTPRIASARIDWLNLDADNVQQAKNANTSIQAEIQAQIVPTFSGGALLDRETIREGFAPALGQAPAPAPDNALRAAELTAAAQSVPTALPDSAPAGSPFWERIRRWVATLAGFPQDAEVRYYLIRPALWLLALIFLALIGLQTQYVNPGATFGANGVYDYIGLFLWGISSDVATSVGILGVSQRFGRSAS